MLQFDFKNDSLNRLAEAVSKSGKSIAMEATIAINKTTAGLKVPASQEIRKELAAPAAVVKKTLAQTRRASPNSLTAVFTVSKTRRIPLKEFKPKQTKAGTSYKISKTRGKTVASGAFMGPKPGDVSAKLKGHVFKRVGEQRLPIRKLKGPSPHGVFVAKEMEKPVTADAEVRLQKEIERRIQYNIFKANQLA